MQALTLDVILRVVFGGGDPALRDAIRRALDMTTSLPRLVALCARAARRGAVAPPSCARVRRARRAALRADRRARRRRLACSPC